MLSRCVVVVVVVVVVVAVVYALASVKLATFPIASSIGASEALGIVPCPWSEIAFKMAFQTSDRFCRSSPMSRSVVC